MTELKEEFKELQSLTKDNATDDDKKRVQELLTDIANDVLGGSKLAPEEYSIVASAFNEQNGASKSYGYSGLLDFRGALGSLLTR